MTAISLAMIVKNEAHILGNCLNSVRGLVDEVIIMDTGSTDMTKFLAKSFGAKQFDFEWCDDFSKARNAAIKECKSDWILVLDADEAIYSRDHEAIRAAVSTTEAYAFNLPIWNYLPTQNVLIMGEEPSPNPFFNDETFPQSSPYPFYVPHDGTRLFRSRGEDVYNGCIHETPHGYFQSRGLALQDSPAVIHHYGKVLEDREASKGPYYLSLAQEEAARHPEDPRAWFNVFQQALVVQDASLVLHAARQYMRLLNKSAPAAIYIGAGMALRELGQIDESIVCFDAVLNHDPSNKVARKQRDMSMQTKK